MASSESKLKAARAALEHIHTVIQPGFGFRLWDGSTIPAAGLPVLVTINDEGVISTLLRRPKLETLIDAWVQGRIDLIGGSLFDLASLRPSGKTRGLRRNLKKRLLLKAALPFLFSSSSLRPSARVDGEGRRDGSEASNKRNISHHYDVSNEFYRLFLDERMVYTCGYFTDEQKALNQAQLDKLDMICCKLRLQKGDRLLDIGCGWGALICFAAQNYGVVAHGVTLSEEQVKLGRERIAAHGLDERVRITLQDFSKLKGSYTKISSIGMFEHVGLRNHRTYFKAVKNLLEPGGIYLHHAITRPGKLTDKAFNKKPAEYKALIRYIFPGGELDHIGMSLRNLEATGFEVHDVEGWRRHYALTTRHWAERLMERKNEASVLVGPQTYRMWELYLCGVSLAFERGAAQIFQTVATRKTKGTSALPLTRDELYRHEMKTLPEKA
ncbi:class I SAM-dependent methyltransferase [Flexibacterium corallicola]|uniref:class I SAM-dependent methyltransferase n=1 Tax=Flexibacterium corallicola TaxID=3037259 RepID=UPI00286F3FFB|nr:class I SAM-dependent methyltransferase [Pseudovibrio sp. M1P-2-3]